MNNRQGRTDVYPVSWTNFWGITGFLDTPFLMNPDWGQGP